MGEMDPKHLGQQSALPASPEAAELDYVPNPRPGSRYLIRFAAPEFTSLCPITGQPDFAHLVIDYVPGETIVESKSLKLFLGSFRNHGAFHEDCTVGIGERLFVPSADAVRVRVRFDVVGATRVGAAWPAGEVTRFPDGSAELAVECEGLEWLVGWVLEFGRHAEIISPPEARRAILERIDGMHDVRLERHRHLG